METPEEEEKLIRSVALQNARVILRARELAEADLRRAKEALEERTRELAQQREWFQVTLSSIGDAVIATDIQGIVTFLNPVAEKMTGWNAGESKGQPLETIFRIVHEQTREPATNPVRKVLQDGGTIAMTNHTALIARDGKEVAIEDSAAPIRDAAGNVSGAVMVFHDVTERRRVEAALRTSHDQFAAIINHSPLRVFLVDSQLCLRHINAKAREGFGEIENLIGRDFVDVLSILWSRTVAITLTSHFRRTLETGEPFFERGFSEVRADRERQEYFDWEVHRVTLPDGQRGVTCYFTDISAHVLAQQELREAQRQVREHAATLEKTVEARTAQLREKIGELEAFSYSVSHDMRSPLRAMQGYATALLTDHKQNLDEEGRHYLERIHKAATRMDTLIQEVLTYSKVAKEELALHPVNLEKLVDEVLQVYPGLQAPKAVITVKGPLPKVFGHEALLTQVISNLLGNAVKFTKPGVTPRATIYGEEFGEMARFSVEDNGIGINPMHFKRIFEIFGRVYGDKKYEGTGIGLAIAKKAVERMGGAIGVESQLGAGSRFWFTLKKSPSV